MTKTTWTLGVLLSISVFFNITEFAVIYEADMLVYQQNEAIQYLGNTESMELKNCHEANEALIRATTVSQLNEAVKNTPLPKMKG